MTVVSSQGGPYLLKRPVFIVTYEGNEFCSCKAEQMTAKQGMWMGNAIIGSATDQKSLADASNVFLEITRATEPIGLVLTAEKPNKSRNFR